MEIPQDELNQPQKNWTNVNLNRSIPSGIILMGLAVVIVVVGLSFDVLFYFPLFMFIAGIVMVIHGVITNRKFEHFPKESGDILDDKNQF